MKKGFNIKKLAALTLAAVAVTSGFAGCGNSEEAPPVLLPDYGTGKQFVFNAYTPMTDGTYYLDDVLIDTGTDFRTPEKFAEYRDCGFNAIMLSGNNGYNGEAWETSTTKRLCDLAAQADIDKIVIQDRRLTQSIEKKVGERSFLIDEGEAEFDFSSEAAKQAYIGTLSEEDAARITEDEGLSLTLKFDTTEEAAAFRREVPTEYASALFDPEFEFASEEAFTEYVKDCLSDYKDVPGFYGIVLRDEPDYTYTESYAQVYRAVRRAAEELGIPDMYINVNLLPGGTGNDVHTYYAKEGTYSDHKEAYTNYMENFIKEAGLNRVCVDTYAFRGTGFVPGFYSSLQIMRGLCDEYGADMSYCLQSFGMYNGQTLVYRGIGKSEMYLELNTLMGLGVDEFYYYTYMPMTRVSTNGAMALEDYSFLNRSGERTNVWYAGQQIMAEAQAFANVILNFRHLGNNLFTSEVSNFGTGAYLSSAADRYTNNSTIDYDRSYEFKLLKGLEQDNDIAFVTELYDDANGLYMYMLQNVIDPGNGEDGNTDMTLTADFGEEYEWAAEFNCGQLRYVKLDGGKYTKTLSAGYAVFLIPLK